MNFLKSLSAKIGDRFPAFIYAENLTGVEIF